MLKRRRRARSVALVLLLWSSSGVCAFQSLLRHQRDAFSSSSTSNVLGGSFLGPWSSPAVTAQQRKNAHDLQMKDNSCSYWFQVGDLVQVSTTVQKAGIDLKGRRGKVTETWEKCSVDPTCCCAEFVDDNYAVTVKFEGTTLLDRDRNSDNTGFILCGSPRDSFTHHFNEDELVLVETFSPVPHAPLSS